MSERLYQFRFGEDFKAVQRVDVTPKNFQGLPYPDRTQEPSSAIHQVGRFVREAAASYQITSPIEAARYLMENIYTPFVQFDQEELWALLLNTKNYVTHEVMIYRGTVNSALIRAPEIFKEAIRVNATAIILSHCHPSGDATPSPEDVQVTKRIREIASLIEIEVEDHIVIGKDAWVSLKDRGLGFD